MGVRVRGKGNTKKGKSEHNANRRDCGDKQWTAASKEVAEGRKRAMG